MSENEINATEKSGSSPAAIAIYTLLIIVIGLLAFNQYQLFSISGALIASDGTTTEKVSTGNPTQDAINAVIPTGTPDYGDGLGVSYDTPTQSLNVLAGLERSISFDSLTNEQQQRHIAIATDSYTACEFCCGIGSKGFGTSDGRIACGCSHNLAFSGLTKYLLKNHENDYTNQDIMNEIQKWKALFFPKQMVARYLQEQVDAGKLDSSALGELPGMVGGC